MYLLGSMTGFRFYVKAGFKIQDCKKKLSLPFLFCKLRLDELIKKKKQKKVWLKRLKTEIYA